MENTHIFYLYLEDLHQSTRQLDILRRHNSVQKSISKLFIASKVIAIQLSPMICNASKVIAISLMIMFNFVCNGHLVNLLVCSLGDDDDGGGGNITEI